MHSLFWLSDIIKYILDSNTKICTKGTGLRRMVINLLNNIRKADIDKFQEHFHPWIESILESVTDRCVYSRESPKSVALYELGQICPRQMGTYICIYTIIHYIAYPL